MEAVMSRPVQGSLLGVGKAIDWLSATVSGWAHPAESHEVSQAMESLAAVEQVTGTTRMPGIEHHQHILTWEDASGQAFSIVRDTDRVTWSKYQLLRGVLDESTGLLHEDSTLQLMASGALAKGVYSAAVLKLGN